MRCTQNGCLGETAELLRLPKDQLAPLQNGTPPNQIDTQELRSDLQWKMEKFQAISPQAFFLEGIAYLRTNRKEEGIEALQTCLALDEEHGLAHYNLAVPNPPVDTHNPLCYRAWLSPATTRGDREGGTLGP